MASSRCSVSSDVGLGEPSPLLGRVYADEITAEIGLDARWFDRTISFRRGMQTAGVNSAFVEVMKKLEARLKYKVSKAMREHVLWPWLEPLKGLAGASTGLLLAYIAHPWRFPGQRCGAAEPHYHTPRFAPGAPCPVVVDKDGGICGAPLEPPRMTTGVSSFHHYCGQHGAGVRKRKGIKADWNTRLRAIIDAPEIGLRAQIIRHKTPDYYEIYQQEKARLQMRSEIERESEGLSGSAAPDIAADGSSENDGILGRNRREVAGTRTESDGSVGDLLSPEDETPADWIFENDRFNGRRGPEATECRHVTASIRGSLRPFQIHQIAMTIAVKRFLGDLLMEWKALSDPYVFYLAPPGQ